jgi:DNA-binding beta-propeller fold protein YncE
MRPTIPAFLLTLASLALASLAPAQQPMTPATPILMPSSIQGRFDHLGIDVKGGRLFAAAETIHQVPVFDLKSSAYLRSIENIEIPHAIFVREDLNRIFITDGGVGAVKVYDGATYDLLATIPLKVDSDSIAYDPSTHQLFVVNGGGDAKEPFSMVSVIDTDHNVKLADIKIDGDTLEAMAIDPASDLMYVNNAAKNEVAVVNRKSRSLVTSWPVKLGQRNVAMALDPTAHRLFVASRSGVISIFDTASGKELAALPIGKGVDDLAFDSARKRLYAPCGTDGLIYVYQQPADPQSSDYTLLGKVPAAPGAKNGLLAPSFNRYFTIVPPRPATPGAIDAYALP